MIHVVGYLVDVLLAVLVIVVVCAALYVASASLLSSLGKFAVLAGLPDRHRAAATFVVLLTGGVACLTSVIIPLHDPMATVFAALATVPWTAWWLLNLWAWRRDPSEMRALAAAIASERADRLRERLPQVDRWRPWTDYIFDVETARRKAAYNPPPI